MNIHRLHIHLTGDLIYVQNDFLPKIINLKYRYDVTGCMELLLHPGIALMQSGRTSHFPDLYRHARDAPHKTRFSY